MIVNDKRTPEQIETTQFIVIGTDRGMSGWGGASKGTSYAAWSCTEDQFPHVLDWVNSRSDMTRVRWARSDWRPRARYCAHVTYYPITEGHPALAGARR